MNYNKILPFLAVALLAFACQSAEKSENPDPMEKSATVKNVAHRGGAKLAPENTLAAIKKAVELGVDMIEIDVILSKDGEVIVIHDDKIDRTTDGEGVVKEMTLAEIKRYDAGSWFAPEFAGEKVPTLEEVFEAINGRTVLLIEIKDGDEKYPGLEKKVVEAIRHYQAKDWVVVQSFNEKTVLRIREIAPDLITYYLLGRNFPEYYDQLVAEGAPEVLPYDGLAVHYSTIDSTMVSHIHEAGYELFVWTVNEVEDMRRVIAAGVDGVITDRPDQLQLEIDR